tara:strand:+ start:4477 stop:4665 length:189 start_codon:yes stop_codon:yes gene_type:complete
MESNKESPQTNLEEQYIQSLNSKELIAIKIAKDQLKSSFDIQKSIGFLHYVKSMTSSQNTPK